jgi:hypothetical protein
MKKFVERKKRRVMFPSCIVDPRSHVTFYFEEATVAYFTEFPVRLNDAAKVVQYILPDVVSSLVNEGNHFQEVDLDAVLTVLVGVDAKVVQEIVPQMHQILEAVAAIDRILCPPSRDLDPLPQWEPSRAFPLLDERLERVVEVARIVAVSDILLPTACRSGTPPLQKFRKACQKLCFRAAEPCGFFPVQKLRDKTLRALHASSMLVHEMAVCYGGLAALVVSASDKGFPPIVRSMADRAAINFGHECKLILRIACPDAAADILPDDASFHWCRLGRMAAFQGVMFDHWQKQADMTRLSKDLLVLANILRDVAKQPAQRHTLRIVYEIQRRYPNRLFLQGFVSHNVLMKAHEVAQLPPPPRNLTSVYRRLIKQQARVAVLAPDGFHLDRTLAFFRCFFEQVRPPIYSSALLTLRVYKLYRAACLVLELTPSPCPCLQTLFQGPSETLVPKPMLWCPAPIPQSPVADAVRATRRKLSLDINAEWLRRLLDLYLDFQKQDWVGINIDIDHHLASARTDAEAVNTSSLS